MNIKTAIAQLTRLSVPIIMGQVGIMLIGVGDIYIASSHSTETVAAIGLANGVNNPIFLLGIGLMMGISAVLSISRGQGKDTSKSLSSIITYAAIAGVVLTFFGFLVNLTVPYLGFDEKIVPTIIQYNNVVIWSFPFVFISNAIKEYLQSFEKVFFANMVNMIAVIVNLGLNYILVFGILSFEGLGPLGLSIASVIIRFLIMIVLIIYVLNMTSFGKVSMGTIKFLFKFSYPIALMFFVEVLAFCIMAILSGSFGILDAAANNIILQYASIAFMVPMSISSAVAVKIGYAYGRQNIQEIISFTKSAYIMIAVFISISTSIFILFPKILMIQMSTDPAVISLGVTLLIVVGFFQFGDSVQIVTSGILRGLKKTKESSIVVFSGYWLIGIPIGTIMAFKYGYNTQGLWIGLAISLNMVAIGLFLFLVKTLKYM